MYFSSGEISSSIAENEFGDSGGIYNNSAFVMSGGIIRQNAYIERTILSESCVVGENASIGLGENVPNRLKPDIYNTGITVAAENTIIPANVKIGKNCVISGETALEDFQNGVLESGGTVAKEADIL